MKRVCLLLCLLFYVGNVHSIGYDIGNCGCMCVDEDADTTVSGSFLSAAPKSKSQFFQNIKGPRGDVGLDGPQGALGERGIEGFVGVRGPASSDLVNKQDALPASCMELVGQTGKSSGIYTLKLEDTGEEIESYCDLQTAGGGWQLVASIHENNIDGKCTPGDNWSGVLGSSGPPTNSWSNYATFGSVDSATSDDYKSPSYYHYQANNLMIWHVPNNKLASEWQEQSTVQYYTDNKFLSTHGGNLRVLFEKYLPIKYMNSSIDSSPLVYYMDSMDPVLQQIIENIVHFYAVQYDGDSGNKISDGGHDMYDGGNEVFYATARDQWNKIQYGKVYFDYSQGLQLYSRESQPFITFMWINNPGGLNEVYGIKVVSDTGADGEGRTNSYVGNLQHLDVHCSYNFYNVFGAGDPSIGELYFSCGRDHWNSSLGRMERGEWSSSTSRISNALYVTENPQNVLMGYILLSRYDGTRGDDLYVSDAQIQTYLRILMASLATFEGAGAINCDRSADSLSTPVQFAKGDAETLSAPLSPLQLRNLVPGYIQFRPISFEGAPYALLPGFKTNGCDPSEVSIGGFPSPTPRPDLHCNDFAGWRKYNENSTMPDATARPDTSILIFTR